MRRIHISAIFLCLLAACRHAPPSTGQGPGAPRGTNEEPGEEWTRARTPVTFAGGEVATNCATYLPLACRSAVREEIRQRQIASEYVSCLQLVARDRGGAALAEVPTADRGRALATRLDLRSFPSSLGPRLSEDKHTLTTLAEAPQVGPASAALSTSDWNFVLTARDALDLDRDGREDWLVSLTDEGLPTTYRDYELLVVRNVTAPGPLKAEPLMPWICPGRDAVSPH